ncbi:MAG: efflux RND transporter periplasmic adaptor subunit [Woeseiaceae bacterium]|nr:efflux RND transporter periplasmic adaptor subunit [Woeseiaceae bacterium]
MTLSPTFCRFACLAAALVLVACDTAPDAEEELLRPVRFLTIADNVDGRDRTFTGSLKSIRESRLSFKVAGTVTDVPVQIGQRLSRGDLIAELDSDSFSLQVEQAQASLVEAQAGERNAESTYERTKGLYANDNASRNELDASRAAAEAAAAQVRAATKALEIARLNVSYTRLTAAEDCSIASVDVEVNENVSAGQQIGVVSCGTEYEVELGVPESLIGLVDQTTTATITFGAIDGMRFTGEITEISTAGSAAVFPVVVRVNEDHPSLRSGLAADVTLQLGTATVADTFVLPLSAVVNDPDGVYVFVVEPAEANGEAIAKRRDVELGELIQDGVEVVAGLAPGDDVVTAGVSVIRDGQRVLVRK